MPNTVQGTDGVTPVYQPEARWCSWNINEIYAGGPGAGRYVPKVGDFIEDTAFAVTYKVTSVDPITLLSTMTQVRTYGDPGPIPEDDILMGVGPGTQADTYRCYLDTSVVPYVLAVDARLKVGGTMTSYAKIFKGTNVASDGKVISFLYDQSGNFLTQNIPLELAATDSLTNHTIKTVAVAYTNEVLVDGEIVTVVLYSDTGHVISKRQLLVENTSFIRSVSSAQKYISHISLKSPFMSASADHLLEYPLNVPLAAFNLVGVVNYSDGSTVELPVDGTKFKIFGLEQYLATVVGQQLNLVLSYSLSPTETAYGAVTSDGKFITEPYQLVTISQQGAYTVKLYPYPVWIDSINGYHLRWFMLNLDRNIFTEVTNLVSFNNTPGYFDPLAYGTLQRLSVRINLRDVSGSFKSYIHAQTVDVILKNQGTQRTTNWTVSTDPTQVQPYGTNIHARINVINQNLTNVKVDSGLTTLSQWLDNVYFNTRPLSDIRLESVPPTPTHFVVVLNGQEFEFPVSAWNDVLSVGGGLSINQTLIIKFIKRTANSTLILSVAGMSIYPYTG